MTDVARRASVSRMTVYRRWPDMSWLATDLIDREFDFVDPSGPGSGTPTAESIAAALVSTAVGISGNPLFRKVVDVDPDLLLPYLLDHRGESQDSVLDALTAAVRIGQRHGDVRRGRPEVLARTVVLMCQGFVLSIATMSDARYSERIARRELTRAVTSYLTAS